MLFIIKEKSNENALKAQWLTQWSGTGHRLKSCSLLSKTLKL